MFTGEGRSERLFAHTSRKVRGEGEVGQDKRKFLESCPDWKKIWSLESSLSSETLYAQEKDVKCVVEVVRGDVRTIAVSSSRGKNNKVASKQLRAGAEAALSPCVREILPNPPSNA